MHAYPALPISGPHFSFKMVATCLDSLHCKHNDNTTSLLNLQLKHLK